MTIASSSTAGTHEGNVSTSLADQPTDGDIGRSVQRMLRGLVTIPPGSVHAAVRDGVVTLTGALAWEHLRTTVHNLIGHLRGVREVVDLISLTERPEAADPADGERREAEPVADPPDSARA